MDKYQRTQAAKLAIAKRQEEEAKFSKIPIKKSSVDLNMRIPKRLDEPRKKALVCFFIQHFINSAKKSNEFRAYGKSLLLVAQSQNLLKILEDMGYNDNKECREFRIELEKLRNICRVGIEGYFRVNYGYESASNVPKPKFSEIRKQTLALPELPTTELPPILGIEDTKRANVAFVEVHDVPRDSTDF